MITVAALGFLGEPIPGQGFWLSWLDDEDAKLFWTRASNPRRKCAGGSHTAWRRWVVALCLIAMKLNGGEQIPGHKSQMQKAALQRRQAL
jgi:hypothetical protein